MRTRHFSVALAAAAAMCPALLAQSGAPASQPVTLAPAARADGWWQARHGSVVERVRQGAADLLFIGDSITQGWETAGKVAWENYYASRRAINLGFSGDGTQHVLWRLDNGELDGIAPKLAVVMIGTNNTARASAEDIASGVEAVVARLRTKLPDTKVLLLAIFPRSERPDERRSKIAAVNALLVKRFGSPPADGSATEARKPAAQAAPARPGADASVRFLDIGASFLAPDGSISKEIMPDFLHLSPQGYAIWAEAIEPHIAELMK